MNVGGKRAFSMGDKVSELQEMLRYIGCMTNGGSHVYVSGAYDSATREAVIDFQREAGSMPNGIVDNSTWSAISEEYNNLKNEEKPAQMVSFFPPYPGYVVEKNENSNLVTVIQIMLNELSGYYDGYAPLKLTGVLDEKTENAIKMIQAAHMLPLSGKIDKNTWNKIAREYNNIFSLNE